jgi:hypothetical protein
MRTLLDGYGAVLGQPSPHAGVTLSAGPFPTTAALHEFERALETLPHVQAVHLRGYDGSDRALVEVLLDPYTT